MTVPSATSPPPGDADVPDVLALHVPFGGRALVVGELRLSGTTTPASALATSELARAVSAWSGPGVLVFNGGLLAQGADPADALAAHPSLLEAVAGFAAGPGRHVIVIPGARDASLAWDDRARLALGDKLGARCALAVDLQAAAGEGTRVVRVEPGHRFDDLSARHDPRSPAETPLAWHLQCEMLANVRRVQPSAPAATGWLGGLDDLDDPGAFPRFLASRLAYRKLGRHAWLLLIPFVAALALRLPAAMWRRAHGGLVAGGRVGLLAAATVVELAVLLGLAVVSLRRTWDALANVALGQERRDPNAAPRAAARDMVTAGAGGLITSHTARAQLVDLGAGFYANTGCAGDTVSESPCRVRGLGLPSVFLASRQVSWAELEVGAVVHVRLVHGRRQLGGATVVERLLASPTAAGVSASGRGLVSPRLVRRREGAPRRLARRREGAPRRLARRREGSAGGGELRVGVVATYPAGAGGPTVWPLTPSGPTRDRRVRRAAAVFVAVAGFISLVSAFSEPLRDRLDALRDVFPIAVPEAAAALAAVGGFGLLLLARGVRRGQKRAWLVCQVLLTGVAVLHVVKGVDVEESLVALAVAAFLWINRKSFSAASDTAGLRRPVSSIAGAAVAALAAGTIGLQFGTWMTNARRGAGNHAGRHAIGWGRALAATAERLSGYQGIPLPHRLDEFFTPAAASTGGCLAVGLAWVLLRPVVRRRSSAGTARAAGAAVPPVARPAGGPRAAGLGAGGLGAGLARARAIVERYGSGTLDYFALRPDKDFFFWGSTVVAYGVYGGSCLVSPDPVGPAAEREEAWRAFRAFADERGWALGILGASEHWLPIYRSSGMHDLYVGDEAIVRVQRFTLEGGRFKGLRQAVNRVAKYGYTMSFHDPSALGPGLRAELGAVMTKSRRGDVERGFSMTLGRAFEPDDRGLLLAVVHGPASQPCAPGPAVAFCQFVPAPGIGGYSLDLMRRDNGDHPNGLIDFAVVETIRHLKDQGMQGLGLNFATMRAVLAGESGDGISQKVQAWMLRRMGDSMQIESLWRFNAKYDPDWQPRYALYDAPENALSTAIAVARAESFWELPVIGRFLVPAAVQGSPPVAVQGSPPVAAEVTGGEGARA